MRIPTLFRATKTRILHGCILSYLYAGPASPRVYVAQITPIADSGPRLLCKTRSLIQLSHELPFVLCGELNTDVGRTPQLHNGTVASPHQLVQPMINAWTLRFAKCLTTWLPHPAFGFSTCCSRHLGLSLARSIAYNQVVRLQPSCMSTFRH